MAWGPAACNLITFRSLVKDTTGAVRRLLDEERISSDDGNRPDNDRPVAALRAFVATPLELASILGSGAVGVPQEVVQALVMCAPIEQLAQAVSLAASLGRNPARRKKLQNALIDGPVSNAQVMKGLGAGPYTQAIARATTALR